jgi:hypothetical protein
MRGRPARKNFRGYFCDDMGAKGSIIDQDQNINHGFADANFPRAGVV